MAGKEQDMAVEIIIQIGDREFWRQFGDMKSYMKLSYQIILDELRKRLPQFVVANAVVHLDEDTGTDEQMDANVEVMVRDLKEILRIGAEQKRLWEVYEGR